MKVLFVDDEIQVLNGLERMLTTMEDEWDLEFVTSATEALESMSESEFDALVTDMRMPGMDGAELLERVSKQHPEVVRIVLSGQASRESVFRAVSPMHQYLSKPCDVETIRMTVSRACALRDVLQSDSLQRLVSKTTRLPSIPSVYNDIVAEIESPDGSIQRIGELVAQDPSMTLKILQIVNSAMFGLRSNVYSPQQATSLLGMDAVRALVLTVGVFQQFDGNKLPGFSIEATFRHSVLVGGCARQIAQEQKCEDVVVNCAFTAGMLQDLGRLVFAVGMPDEYSPVLTEAAESGRPIAEVETEMLGANHAAIGAYLLELWGLPQQIIETIAFHETPDSIEDPVFSPLTALVAANTICPSGGVSQAAIAKSAEYLKRRGFGDKLPVWSELCEGTWEEPEQ